MENADANARAKREICPACQGNFPAWWARKFKHRGDIIIDCWHGPREIVPVDQNKQERL